MNKENKIASFLISTISLFIGDVSTLSASITNADFHLVQSVADLIPESSTFVPCEENWTVYM